MPCSNLSTVEIITIILKNRKPFYGLFLFVQLSLFNNFSKNIKILPIFQP
ncbi:hypothetical protein C874_10910 [Elizabethkingia anophelis 502]|nr:hypothetical protein C874_10910 [Elizabethkingia anophelis 502]